MKKMYKMNKLILYLFLITAFHLFAYEYFKEIKITGKLNYKEFFLTEDIYANSKNNLGDIRIIDKTGKEVPYVIESEKIQNQYIEKIVARARIAEKITKKDKIEFIIKFVSNNPLENLIGNKLEIIPTKNFYTEYELLGSNNGTNWEHITSGEVYKTPEKENLTIKFSNKRYDYYKIVTPVEKGDIFSEAILKLSDSKTGKAGIVETNLTYEVEQKEKSTILKINSKFLPLKNIVLDVDDEFKRSYSVGDKDGYYDEGTISKVGKTENLTINLENIPRTDQIIVEIKNGDNAPLKIKNIKGIYVPEKIIFKAENGENHKITFGDTEKQKPEYDLEQFVDMIKEKDLVSVGEMQKVKKLDVPKTKDYTVYYNVFIGVIVVILIGFMVRKIGK